MFHQRIWGLREAINSSHLEGLQVEVGRTDQLILAVTSEPVLHFPADIGEWRVEADSSDYTTGACLMQCQNGVWVPIVFMSKGLNDTEENNDIHDKEILAIMWALYKW
jgi:hypothetical protein